MTLTSGGGCPTAGLTSRKDKMYVVLAVIV